MPGKTPTKNQLLTAFIHKLLAEKGLTNLAPAERVTMVQSLKSELDDWIDRAMLASLSDEELNQLEELMKSGADDAVIGEFFANCSIDYTKAMQQAMMAFREEFLAAKEGEQ